MNVLLELIDVWISYNGDFIVNGVSLCVKAAQTVVLLGRNGSGKTTILRTIAGELMPRQGEVVFQGMNITGMEPRSLIKRGLSYLPQGKECFPDLTVEENLKIALLPHDLKKEEKRKRREMALAWFPLLKGVLKRPVHQISGGFQQMLATAMILSQEPKCLLLDEPSHGLAPAVLDSVKCVLKDIVNSGKSILLVEQKPKFALDLGDYAYYIENGRITLEGTPKKLMNNPEFIKNYIGKKEENHEKETKSARG
jgi:ABC-type branched-subunit amino acid transport system ATPase component